MHSQTNNSVPNSSRQILATLRGSQHWTADQLRELQWSKLETLLRHAYDSCEFYRERLDKSGLHPQRDFTDFECLAKLPILTKTEIQQSAGRMVSTDPRVTGITANSTGGSTGMPLNFCQDDNYRLWADAARVRAWRWHKGISRHAIEAVLWGAIQDVGRGFSLKSATKDVLRYRTLQLNTFDLDADTIKKYFRVYNLVRPQILRGYSSSLFFIANFVAAHGINVKQPRIIISSADMLRSPMRARISDVFGADVIDSYGCREVSQIATECLSHNGLHIVMENQYVEIVEGRIIVTNLNNLGMPFIRYQIGDLAEGIDILPCGCGRHSHRIVGLKGRDNDNIEFPGGKVVSDVFFEFLFFRLPTVEQYQVVYSKSEQRLRVRVQVTNRSEKIDEIVAKKMEECFGFRNVTVEFTDHFDKTPTGKFRFVYSVDSFDY
jgi:phenylacetate-CoA ligase